MNKKMMLLDKPLNFNSNPKTNDSLTTGQHVI